MDKLLYIAASGAKQDLMGTAVRANNLANANTTGFRAQLEQARAMPAFGEGLPTRVFAMTESPANNFESGAMTPTGRQLDLAIQGQGFFTVMDEQGNEAYTRAGSMRMGPEGQIQDASGNMVMGDFGPIFVPIPVSNINIAKDGTISVRPQGAPENALEAIGRLKLVNPQTADLQRGNDGLFRLKSGDAADASAVVRIESGMLEGSNVNAIDEMVKMMELQRHYELQVKFMKKAGELDRQSNRLLTIL